MSATIATTNTRARHPRAAKSKANHQIKEIANLLHISPRTVETHKYNIMQKLKLKTTAELIKYAIKQGIVTI